MNKNKKKKLTFILIILGFILIFLYFKYGQVQVDIVSENLDSDSSYTIEELEEFSPQSIEDKNNVLFSSGTSEKPEDF